MKYFFTLFLVLISTILIAEENNEEKAAEYIRKACQMDSLGNHATAIRFFKKANKLTDDPQTKGEIFYDIAYLYFIQDKIKETISFLDEIIELAENGKLPYEGIVMESLSTRVILYGEEMEASVAKAEYDKVIAIAKRIEDKDTYKGLLHNCGVFYSKNGQMEKGNEMFKEAIRINPLRKDSYISLAINLAQEGRHSEAALHLLFGLALTDIPLKATDYSVAIQEYILAGVDHHFKRYSVNYKSCTIEDSVRIKVLNEKIKLYDLDELRTNSKKRRQYDADCQKIFISTLLDQIKIETTSDYEWARNRHISVFEDLREKGLLDQLYFYCQSICTWNRTPEELTNTDQYKQFLKLWNQHLKSLELKAL